jgi:ribosomal protein S6
MSENTKQLYELSYLIPNSVAENELQKVLETIKALIEKNGGEVDRESDPQLRDLAYKIAKNVESKRDWYEKAYFGWLSFTADADKIIDVNTALSSEHDVLRHLVIKTDDESVAYSIEREQKEAEELEDDEEEQEDDGYSEGEEVGDAQESKEDEEENSEETPEVKDEE